MPRYYQSQVYTQFNFWNHDSLIDFYKLTERTSCSIEDARSHADILISSIAHKWCREAQTSGSQVPVP